MTEEFTNHLREEFRLKLNVDYSYTKKYNELHILCNKVYADTIREEAFKFSIPITCFHCY
jgi:hypothetical protein